MLTGWTSDGQYHVDSPSSAASQYYGWYLQDDWEVTRKLALNLGVRHDFAVPRRERYTRL